MFTRTLSWLLVASVPVSSALGLDPADPEARVPPGRYSPVISGTKSYRPVEPLPWADINRRVMPPDAVPPSAPGQGKALPKAKDDKGQHGQH